MKKIMNNIKCFLGFHDKESDDDVWMQGSVNRNWFDSGRTSYWVRSVNCTHCGQRFRFSWSYETPYDEWSWKSDGSWTDWNGNKRDKPDSYILSK